MVIQAGRQFAYAVARLMAKGEAAMEASMVKAYVCKAAEWVTREAMQIHGGMGYAEEYPVSRLFVDARVLSIFEGADETLCLQGDRPPTIPPHRLTRLRPFQTRALRPAQAVSSRPVLSPSGPVRSRRSGVVVVGVEEKRMETRRGRRRCPSSPNRRRRRCDRSILGEVRRGRGRRSPDPAWRRRRRGCRRCTRIVTCGRARPGRISG